LRGMVWTFWIIDDCGGLLSRPPFFWRSETIIFHLWPHTPGLDSCALLSHCADYIRKSDWAITIEGHLFGVLKNFPPGLSFFECTAAQSPPIPSIFPSLPEGRHFLHAIKKYLKNIFSSRNLKWSDFETSFSVILRTRLLCGNKMRASKQILPRPALARFIRLPSGLQRNCFKKWKGEKIQLGLTLEFGPANFPLKTFGWKIGRRI
jgi:hypothetical protein